MLQVRRCSRLVVEILVAAAFVAGCGARSDLAAGVGPGDGVGGSSSSGSRTSATPASSAGGGGARCSLDDLSTWREERYRDEGDYPRGVAAASGQPWICLHENGAGLVLLELDVDASGIVVKNRLVASTEDVYPIALDVDDARFVLLTSSDHNFNGELDLWRLDRADGSQIRVPVEVPPDLAFTVGGVVVLAGADLLVAHSTLANPTGTVELRTDALDVIDARVADTVSFAGVRTSDVAADVFVGASQHLHAEAGILSELPVDPAWEVIGGLGSFRVEVEQDVRLVDGARSWSAPWPETQFSPPAVVRTSGSSALFSLEGELSPVLGFVSQGALTWRSIDPTLDAPGTGVGILPVVTPNRIGVFYLGLEIPSPLQPLRYFGLVCP